MNLGQMPPNLTLSLCFYDLLVNFAPNYDLKRNQFTSNHSINNKTSLITNIIDQTNFKHLQNLSVQELVLIVENISLNQLFELKIKIKIIILKLITL